MDNLTAKISEIDWRSMTPAEIDTLLVERIRIYEEAIAMRGGKRPKREGCIIEKMASMWNLQAADDEAQKGKKTRTVKRRGKTIRVLHRHIRRHNERREQELRALQMMILTLDFPECKFSLEKVKTDAGKVRIIAKQDFYPWRILQHAILRVIEPKAYASIIPGSFACIKGRGLHYGVRLLKRQLRRHPELKWMWKTDFKKFYPSIPHELMEREFSALFKDAHFIALVRLVLLNYDSGDEIEKILNEEAERTKRNANWRGRQSNVGESCREAHRPCRSVQGEEPLLPAVLRRRARIGENQGGSKEAAPGLLRKGDGTWTLREVEHHNLSERS